MATDPKIPPGVNDSRQRGPRHRAAEELARRLATEDGLRTVRLLGLTSPEPRSPEPGAASGGPSPPSPLSQRERGSLRRPTSISIWNARDNGELVFIRPEPLLVGDHYAVRREIRARREPHVRRVAFFGESAAAGYLYAPHLTPAVLLETQLCRVTGQDWEIVDLARTNETLKGLVTTVERSLQLDPDLLVIFAGNNWNLLETPEISPYVPSVPGRQRYAEALAEGISGPRRLAAGELRQRAEAALDAVAEMARERRIPVVLVIPEVNLADWESRQPVHWLPGDATARWWEHYGEATRALAHEDYPVAQAHARRLLDLDGGTTSTSWRVLARAELGRGRAAAACEAARAEVDHASYATLAFLDAPRATSAVHEILRHGAARFGWGCVDLPELLRRQESLPGRRFFLDYCHLTSEGMRLAMAALASEIVRELQGDDISAGLFHDVAVPVTREAEALARLGAALHSAHRLLAVNGERAILEHWCQAALAASPGIAAAMRDLVDARATPGPAVLSAAQDRNFNSSYRLLHQHGWRWDFLDAEILLVLGDLLDGLDVHEHLAERLGRDSDTERGTELTTPPFLWQPLERFYPEVMDVDLDRRATLRSPWPSTSFCLVHAGGDSELDLTARLSAIASGGGRSGEVEILVNGYGVGRCRLAETWTRHRLRLPATAVRRGLNRVTLAWPRLPPDGDAALAAAVHRLELGREADIHPIFGEVASLRVSNSGKGRE